jgi:Dolichyl-phosphate-mannose-protein mannosyltransferase
VLVGAITVAALLLRVAAIDTALFGDELFTWAGARRDSLREVLDFVRRSGDELNPPLFALLAWLTGKLGDPTVTLRLPSLVAGTVTVPLVYALGARTVDRRAGLIGAMLFAISPFAVFYGSEARAYALLACLVALSSVALLNALEARSPRWWVVFAAASLGALLTHYTAVLVLGGQALWALWAHPECRRRLLLAHAAVLAGYLVWLPSQLEQRRAVGGEGVIEALEPLTPGSVARAILKLIPGHPFAPLREIPGRPALVLFLAAVAVAGAVALLTRRARLDLPRPVILLVMLTLATPVGALLYSLASTSIFLPRNLIASLPAACLCVGAVLTSPRGSLRLALVSVAVAAVAFGTVRSLEDDFERPPYGRVADFLEREARSSDAVLEVETGIDEPSLALEAEFDPPPPLRRMRPGQTAVPADVLLADRVLLVLPRFGPPAQALRPDPLIRRFRRADARVYAGLVPVAVETYVRRR